MHWMISLICCVWVAWHGQITTCDVRFGLAEIFILSALTNRCAVIPMTALERTLHGPLYVQLQRSEILYILWNLKQRLYVNADNSVEAAILERCVYPQTIGSLQLCIGRSC